jgi:hypothetical protein
MVQRQVTIFSVDMRTVFGHCQGPLISTAGIFRKGFLDSAKSSVDKRIHLQVRTQLRLARQARQSKGLGHVQVGSAVAANEVIK